MLQENCAIASQRVPAQYERWYVAGLTRKSRTTTNVLKREKELTPAIANVLKRLHCLLEVVENPMFAGSADHVVCPEDLDKPDRSVSIGSRSYQPEHLREFARRQGFDGFLPIHDDGVDSFFIARANGGCARFSSNAGSGAG